MTPIWPALALAVALAIPLPARAASDTAVGVGTGAVAGALIAGPVGAVAGAIVGGVVGASSERPRRARRVRARARRAAAPVQRVVQRSAPARALTPTLSAAEPMRTGSGAPRAWTDPR